MKLAWPRKRTLLAAHRWLGIISAVFLVSLSLTGLALNHTERLGLNNIRIKNGLILSRYGMVSGSDILSFRIHGFDTLSYLEGQLFYSGQPLATGGPPVGLHEQREFSVIATIEALIFVTREGEFIERMDVLQLPFAVLQFIASSPEGEPLLVTDAGQWKPDADWIEFEPYEGGFSVEPLYPAEIDEAGRQSILEAHQGNGLTLYRVLLDLHSGRLFGWGGRTVMDLTAVAILLLVSSGIAGWLRKSVWARH
ncbi:MAG: PepSY domain-containing protein [Puniceicoccaceae bacterium]